jgi:putative transposase
MRSGKKFRVSAQEVHSHAEKWVGDKLGLKDHGPKCTKSVLVNILFVAAARMCSVFAACRDLANAPSDQAVRDALFAGLPAIRVLEKRLNDALCYQIPKRLMRKARVSAMDLTLIPFHGEPEKYANELYHSAPKSGTTKFHAYATAYVTHDGFRYTLAVTRVTKGEKMAKVIERLLARVRDRGIKVKLLLLDRGFYSVEVMGYLKQAGVPFLMPVVMRGRKASAKHKAGTGLRPFLKKASGWYSYVVTGKKKKEEAVRICVSAKYRRDKKQGKKRLKRLIYAAWGYRGNPSYTRDLYRRRFGIETSYRQMNQARIRTCTRSPLLRLLFFAIALILRNVWVWLHYTIFADKRGEQPVLRLELLRFRRMLHWIESIVEKLLHNGEMYYVEWQVL